MKDLIFITGKNRFDVRLRKEGDGLIVNINGKDYRVEYVSSGKDDSYMILVNNRPFEATIDSNSRGELCVSVRGRRHQLRIIRDHERVKDDLLFKREKGGIEHVRANITGLIVDVKVREGDVISSGEPLVVIEAMKMQNTITGRQSGRISKVYVKRGQMVKTGDMIATIEA